MDKKSKKALILDDNDSVRSVLEALLIREGFEVTAFSGGDQVLELLKDEKSRSEFSVILLDILMPGTNGMDVLKAVKAQEDMAEIPVIMVTTKDLGEDLMDAYQIGADYYLPKPFTPKQLRYGLQMVLNPNGVEVEPFTFE